MMITSEQRTRTSMNLDGVLSHFPVDERP